MVTYEMTLDIRVGYR